MEKEKVVKIKYPDGNEHDIVLHAITRRQRRELNILALPPKFNQKASEDGSLEMDSQKLEAFKDALVKFAVRTSPPPVFDDLEDEEFNKLLTAAQELNPGADLKKQEATSKKSESPSSVA